MQWVLVIEVQGLYAAAARAAGLAPADRPVVVVCAGRVCDGCQGAFAAGLQLGSPVAQVLRDVPRAVQVDLAQVDATRQARSWWDRCLLRTPYVEPVEPHLLYLGLPTPAGGVSRALRREAEALVDEAAAVGFVAFAGLATTRVVARAAALACKDSFLLRRPGRQPVQPQRLVVVEPGEEARFLAPLPLACLPVPAEIRRRVQRLGLQQIGEAARVPEAEWVRQLGAQGRQLWRFSQGIDPEPVRPAYPPRRLTRRIEFGSEVRDHDLLERELNRAVAPLVRQLTGRGEGCQLVALIIERQGGPALHAERTLAKLQQAPYPLQTALQGLLTQVLAGHAGELEAKAITAEVGLIGPMPWQQLDLWDDRARREREERLERALALLHERFPGRMVGLGARTETPWREQMLQFADPYRWPSRGA